MLSGWFTQRRVVKCSFESQRSAPAMNSRVHTNLIANKFASARLVCLSLKLIAVSWGPAFARTDSVNPRCFVEDLFIVKTIGQESSRRVKQHSVFFLNSFHHDLRLLEPEGCIIY